MKSLKSFPQLNQIDIKNSFTVENDKLLIKTNFIHSEGCSKTSFNIYKNIELNRKLDENCQVVPKISGNTCTLDEKSTSLLNINIKILPNSSLYLNEHSSIKTLGDSTEASNFPSASKISFPSVSKRWTKISNLIKAVKFLHMYDTVSIKEHGDIEHNLEDYKNRLLNNSPIKRCKTKNKEQLRKNTEYKVKEYTKPEFSHVELNIRTLSNANLPTDRFLLEASNPITQMKTVIKKATEVENPKLFLSENLKPAVPCKVAKTAQVQSCYKKADLSYSAESNYSSLEPVDEVHVEMNKISVIERIKDYILE